MKVHPTRTNRQNRSLHKYCEEVADALNAAGWDMKKTLKPEVDIPWNKDMVKEHLWRPIQEIVLDKESTTELDTSEPSKVYDVLDRHLGEKFGIHVPWPQDEEEKS